MSSGSTTSKGGGLAAVNARASERARAEADAASAQDAPGTALVVSDAESDKGVADLLADLGLPAGTDRGEDLDLPALDEHDGTDGGSGSTAAASASVPARAPRRTRTPPERALASAALALALKPAMMRRLRSGERLVLSITVPDAAWVEPVGDAVRQLAGSARVICRAAALRASDVAREEADTTERIRAGRTVVGIAPSPARMLPAVLLTTADGHVEVPPPSPMMIGIALRRAMRGRVPVLPVSLGAGLGFHELVACLRDDETATRAVGRLVAASATRARATPTDDAPTLDTLEGYGAAREWGLGLGKFLSDWRAGAVPWSAYPTSALLAGSPGTGKTLFARSLAKTIGARLVVTSVGNWFASSSGYLDGVIKQIESIWIDARSIRPTVLFIDELDALPDRATMSDRGRDWWTPVVNFVLTLVDGATTARDGLILLGATNHPDRIDRALLRPGRLDKLFAVLPPDGPALAAILRSHLGNDLPDVDLVALAETTAGATGAIAAGWVRDARARAHDAGRALATEDLLAAIQPADTRPEAERRRVALHEAGHAVVVSAIGRETVTLVSIVETGTMAGHTVTRSGLPGSPTRAELEDRVTGYLGGRAADIVLGDGPSAGAGADGQASDLAMATTLVGQIHGSYGLGELVHQRLDPADVRRGLLLDVGLTQLVEADLRRLQARAVAIVEQNRGSVLAIADTLLARSTLTGPQVQAMLVAGAGGSALGLDCNGTLSGVAAAAIDRHQAVPSVVAPEPRTHGRDAPSGSDQGQGGIRPARARTSP